MASFDVDSWAKGRELSKRTRLTVSLNQENLQSLIVGEISRRPDAEQLSDLSDANTNSDPSCDSAPSSPSCLKEHMLSDDDRESITDNLTKLLRDLHCSEILDRLEEGGLITPYQREQIKNENTRYDTNRKFLNWVTTTPKETYIETKRAMRETNQGHLARLLEESAEKRRRKRKQGTQSQLPSGKTRKRSPVMRDVGVQQQQQMTSLFTSVAESFRFDFAAIRHISDTEGYLHDVTPVKISKNDRKYFNAILQTDHTSYSEVVCYNAKQHAAFTKSCEKGTQVRLDNAIPLPRKSPKDTITIECGNKVKITEITTRRNFMKATPPIVITYLRDIKQRSEYQKVSVRVKILEVDQHCQTFTTRRDEELKFQELIVADATAAIVLRIWEDQINRLKVGRSYRVLNVRVCHKGDIVFLGGNKETEIAKVRDIGKVVRFSDETLQHPR